MSHQASAFSVCKVIRKTTKTGSKSAEAGKSRRSSLDDVEPPVIVGVLSLVFRLKILAAESNGLVSHDKNHATFEARHPLTRNRAEEARLLRNQFCRLS